MSIARLHPIRSLLFLLAVALITRAAAAQAPRDAIPLPEHPRPDFERAEWLNLNGSWRFAFDAANRGEESGWSGGELPGDQRILVPFSWAAPLSGVGDTVNIGWYARSITVPAAWRGKRIFVVFGAVDWRSTAWLDGTRLGDHQGGYTPFAFELTRLVRFGQAQRLVLRVDDTPHPFKLEGKQGYGRASGIWQTVYLEARGSDPLASVRFTPHQDLAGVGADVRLAEPAPADLALRMTFTNRAGRPVVTQRISRGDSTLHFDVPLPRAHRWSLDDPFLHWVDVTVAPAHGRTDAPFVPDRVRTYFGMRTISVVDLPGTNAPYVAINGSPVYLQLTLDQAYHPTGFYTFPTDSALRMEVLRPRQIGLNGMREHIKIETPRKLYWADRLGFLVMADVPNWWGPPDSASFAEHEVALRGMIDRDYNHPAVFSWVLFNEAWGLISRVGDREQYLLATQQRVAQVWRLAKSLDSTRLVEDNSPCCGWQHTETDLNSWHDYLPGWRWERHVARISDSTFPGSSWNFAPPWRQVRQPMLNSEFGNVWGYRGSTGDVDWSWDYHRAINAFRRHPRLAGWLYTEHADVINEWNGYWRDDRTAKVDGLDGVVPGMTLRDLHAPLYVVVGDSELAHPSAPNDTATVALYASFLDGRALGDSLTLELTLSGTTTLGEPRTWWTSRRRIPYRPWMSEALEPARVPLPGEPGLAVLATRLVGPRGIVLQRNFTTFLVTGDAAPRADQRIVRVPATSVTGQWSGRQWTVLGQKLNGTGSGFFEYRLPWPAGLDAGSVGSATFLVEVSAKRLNGKDRDTTASQGDYMRGGGFHDRSRNPNSYPMTSAYPFRSAVTVEINGVAAGRHELPDDPADSRGILSWLAQPHDGTLHEAGSYGWLLRIALPREALDRAAREGSVVVRLVVGDALPGGLAVYGARFGRYPVDPTVVFVTR